MVGTKQNGLAIYAGGNHIFYIIGVLKYLVEKGLKFDAVATYSSGSAIVPFLIDNDFASAPEVFGKLLDQNSSNFYPTHLFTKADIFPHDQIYSTAVRGVVNFQKTAAYPKPLRVIVSKFESSKASRPAIGIIATISMLLNSMLRTATPSIFLTAFKSLFSICGEIVEYGNALRPRRLLKLSWVRQRYIPSLAFVSAQDIQCLMANCVLLVPSKHWRIVKTCCLSMPITLFCRNGRI